MQEDGSNHKKKSRRKSEVLIYGGFFSDFLFLAYFSATGKGIVKNPKINNGQEYQSIPFVRSSSRQEMYTIP